MQKHINNKLIHLFGGYTEFEFNQHGISEYVRGVEDNNKNNKTYLQQIETNAYGKSKQEWIDIMHNAIKHL